MTFEDFSLPFPFHLYLRFLFFVPACALPALPFRLRFTCACTSVSLVPAFLLHLYLCFHSHFRFRLCRPLSCFLPLLFCIFIFLTSSLFSLWFLLFLFPLFPLFHPSPHSATFPRHSDPPQRTVPPQRHSEEGPWPRRKNPISVEKGS